MFGINSGTNIVAVTREILPVAALELDIDEAFTPSGQEPWFPVAVASVNDLPADIFSVKSGELDHGMRALAVHCHLPLEQMFRKPDSSLELSGAVDVLCVDLLSKVIAQRSAN